MNIIKRIVLACLIFLSVGLGGVANAATTDTSASSSTIKEIFDVQADYSNDSAQKWLKQLFGSFIFTSNATSSAGSSSTGGSNSDVTVLATAVGFSNVLAMIFGIVVVAYMFIAGSMNTAHHGEALGKNWSSVWLPVRLATGFGLVMPAGTFGGGAVSTIQALTIWIILVGSNAANVLWNTISDKVSTGVSINSNVMVPAAVSQKLLTMLSCTYTYMNTKGNDVAFSIDVPGISDAKSLGTGSPLQLPKIEPKTDAYGIQFGDGGVCGEVTFRWTSDENIIMPNQNSSSQFTFLQTAKDKGNKAAKTAFFNYLNEMIVATNKFQSPIKSGGLGGAEGIQAKLASVNDDHDMSAYNDVANQLFAAGADMSIQLPKDVSNAMVSDDFSSAFASELKKGGWGTAGLWFMRVGSVQNMISEITGSFSDTVTPATPTSAWYSWSNNDDMVKEIETNRSAIITAFSTGASNYIKSNKAAQTEAETNGTALPEVDLRINMAMDSQSTTGCNQDACSSTTEASLKSVHTAKNILGMLSKTTSDVKLQGSSSVTDTTGIASPFATAAAMGNMSINIMESMYAAAALGSVIEYVPGIGKAISGAGKLTGAGKAIGTVLFGIGTYFGAVGVTLAFVIPFMPALLWMMMMIGYLLAVIEAMIASPFATIMMVTPEGEGIAGTRLERAMALLALCVLRPSLMVMGLVAAITLSSVAFGIFNQFFWYTAETSITGSVLTILVIIGMYTAGIFQICKYSISVMTQLPDQILEWMGMNASRQFGHGEAMDGAMKGVEGGVQASQNVMKTVATDMKRRLDKKTGM